METRSAAPHVRHECGAAVRYSYAAGEHMTDRRIALLVLLDHRPFGFSTRSGVGLAFVFEQPGFRSSDPATIWRESAYHFREPLSVSPELQS